jgi:hypothetical protein
LTKKTAKPSHFKSQRRKRLGILKLAGQIDFDPNWDYKTMRRRRIKTDVAFLEKSIKGAPLRDPSDKQMTEIIKAQHRIRARTARVRRA